MGRIRIHNTAKWRPHMYCNTSGQRLVYAIRSTLETSWELPARCSRSHSGISWTKIRLNIKDDKKIFFFSTVFFQFALIVIGPHKLQYLFESMKDLFFFKGELNFLYVNCFILFWDTFSNPVFRKILDF